MIGISAHRRDMLRATAGFAGASLLGALRISPVLAAEMGKVTGRSEQPLKAAFSNIGLQVSWCAQGKPNSRILKIATRIGRPSARRCAR
jgi:ribose transport system substrate-binding protein